MYTKKMCLIIFLIFYLIACDNSNNKKRSVIPDKVNSIIENSNKDSHQITKESQKLDSFRITNKSNFKIISAKKSIENTDTNNSLIPCNGWKLNFEEIIDIFKSSKKISGTEWDLSYEVLPCSYKGEIIIDGKRGNYEINAASFIILIFKDTSIFLGCTQKSKRKYFLSAPF